MVVPKMISASGSIDSLIRSAASSVSIRPRFISPLKLIRTLFAPSIVVSSRGLWIAIFAAISALFSPAARPIPMWATPLSAITVRTSAKSRLITPGLEIRSAIPCTPCLRISSALRNASVSVVFLSMMLSSLWLGMITSVSTFFFSSAIPFSALLILFLPSKLKGFVTTPTVRIPSSLEIAAILGAAPVPVPPPIPAVMNTISEPRRACAISSCVSSTDFSPISGLPPAPRPLVSFSPI